MRLHTAITALAASSTFFSAGVVNASTPRIEDDGMTTATISTGARDGEYMLLVVVHPLLCWSKSIIPAPRPIHHECVGTYFEISPSN